MLNFPEFDRTPLDLIQLQESQYAEKWFTLLDRIVERINNFVQNISQLNYEDCGDQSKITQLDNLIYGFIEEINYFRSFSTFLEKFCKESYRAINPHSNPIKKFLDTIGEWASDGMDIERVLNEALRDKSNLKQYLNFFGLENIYSDSETQSITKDFDLFLIEFLFSVKIRLMIFFRNLENIKKKVAEDDSAVKPDDISNELDKLIEICLDFFSAAKFYDLRILFTAENSGFKNDLYELMLLNLADIRQHLIEIENVLINSSSDIMDTKTKLTIRKTLEEIYQLFDTPQTN